MSEDLRADVRRQGGLSVIELHGDLDAAGEAVLREAYAAAEAHGSGGVLLEFRDVGYINSTGIALVVGLLAEARKSRRSILAAGLSDHYREIFQVTRLADFMPMVEDEEEAARMVAEPAGAP